MKKYFILICVFCSLSAFASDFSVKVTDADNGRFRRSQIYTACGGGNISPGLVWSNPPAGTKSFAVTIFDPDAPGKGWTHWVVSGIPTTFSGLEPGAGNSARLGYTQSRTDFGTAGYGGPCPPAGKPHRYVFTVYAESVRTPDIKDSTPPDAAIKILENSAVGKAKTIVMFGR